MSINPNHYADAEEIAAAIGKSPRNVRRMADKEHGNWAYMLEKIRGTEKKWFLIKGLPKAIQETVFIKRYTTGVNDEQARKAERSAIYQQAGHDGYDGKTDGRDSGHGDSINGLPAVIHGASQGKSACHHADVASPNYAGVGGNRSNTVSSGSKGNDRGLINGIAASQQAGNAGFDQNNKAPRDGLLAVDSKGSPNSDLTHGLHAGLPASHRQAVKTDEKQRVRDGARQYILNFVKRYPGSLEKAVAFINEGFQAGTLDADMREAVLHCNDKANAERVGKLAPRTLQRWGKLKSDNGCCVPLKTRLKTDWRGVEWLNWYFGFYRKPQKPGISEAYRLFAADYEQRDLSTPVPSEFAVRRLLKTVPKLVLEWGRSTGAEYKAMQAFIRRDWSGSSNEIWVGDGHTFKAKVRHPDAPDRLAFAPEVTVIIDAASRFIVGWAFSLSENQIAVSEALGSAMIKHGKPLIYYSDNGSGQTAKTIDCPAGGMLARLGVAHETGIPGNPQGRGLIEGLWDITAIWVAKQFPTFQGTGMDGETLRKNTVAINKTKNKNGSMPSFVPTWEAFVQACEARFEWYNTQHQHSVLGGKTPAEVYYANFDESWACQLTDEEKATLYRPYVLRTPRRGEVHFINNIYFHKALEALPAKAQVRVSYDLHDAQVVWISDLDGVFICEAIWDGNKVDGFEKSFKQDLKQKRVANKRKLAKDKLDAADMEASRILEGESRQVIEFVLPEPAPEKIVLQPVIERAEPIEKQRPDNLFPLNPPTQERKLTADETWQRLFLNDQEEEVKPEKKRI